VTTAMLHPRRLGSRAVDGVFHGFEVPSLLLRGALFGHTGRLELTQSDATRAFTFDQGRLVEVESTAASEAVEAFLALAPGQRRLAQVVRSATAATASLRTSQALEPQALLAVLKAQARHVVWGALGGGEAVAWFEPQAPSVEPGPDLECFAAVWEALSRRYNESELERLADRLGPRLRVNDAAPGLLRQVQAEPSLLRMAVAAQSASASDRWRLGALTLLGLIHAENTPVAPPVGQLSPVRDEEPGPGRLPHSAATSSVGEPHLPDGVATASVGEPSAPGRWHWVVVVVAAVIGAIAGAFLRGLLGW
jgi:hypothetical protein